MISSRRPDDMEVIEKTACVTGVGERQDYSLVRNGTGPTQEFMGGDLKLEVLTHGLSSNEMEAMVATMEPGSSCWEQRLDVGGKWYHVLEGEVDILVNDILYCLSEGDSIYIEPDCSHIWRNSSEKRAKALVLSALPPQAS